MIDIYRKINELVSLYTLESELFDLYVEGVTDKLILDNYYYSQKTKLKIIEIDTLDFDGLDFGNLDPKSNKNKLIILSRVLSENKISPNVRCLIDKDFDGILEPEELNNNLLKTDYCCMESYFFNERPISKFLDIGIRNFPYDSKIILGEIGKVLKSLFIIGLIKIKFKLNCKLLKIDNNINVNKSTGEIEFDFDSYLEKFIIANNLNNHKGEILDFISVIVKQLDSDVRNTMNGHHFMEILFLYINKIKNTPNFKQLNFERAFLLSIQPDYFDEYPLFKLIKTSA